MAAVDYFLKIMPVKGESRDKDYKEHIELLSWSIGAHQHGTGGAGGGGGAGKVQMSDLSISKHADKSSSDLFLACCNGKHFDEAWIICRKAGEHPLEFLKIKLQQVLVSSYQTSGHGGDLIPVEQVTLNFAKIQMEYKEQKPDGTAGPSSKKGWDVAAHQEHS
jgi:type VI secretion system secreted protein Hcp